MKFLEHVRFLALFFGCAVALQASAQFNFDASIRPRAEYRYGYKRLAQNDLDPVFIVTQRSRLGGTFKSDRITLRLSIQDVRVWGDESLTSGSGVFGDEASIDVAEAWVKYQANSHFSVVAGRQALALDDERLLASRNWNQHALFYDALLMTYASGGTTVKAGASYNNQADVLFREPYSPKKMKALGFVHLNQKYASGISLSCIALASSFTQTDTTLSVFSKLTSGIMLEYTRASFSFMSNFYYQFGKEVNSGQILDANAYNLNLKGKYERSRYVVEMGFTLLSGDKSGDAQAGKTQLFDLLYGARHRYYGYLDYFSNLGSATGRGGLNDSFVMFNYSLKETVNAFVHYHLFYLNKLPVALQSPTGEASASLYLASEFDLGVKMNYKDYVSLQTGYSFMLPGEQMKKLQHISGNSPFSSWVWLMITVSLKG